MPEQDQTETVPSVKGSRSMERLAQGPAAPLVRHVLSREVGAWVTMWPHYMAIQKAHLLMLNERGLISRENAHLVAKALNEIRMPQGAPAVVDGSDLYFIMEKLLIDTAGDAAGGRLHLGRSRNDMNAAAIRMIARDQLIEAFRGTLDLQNRLLDVAELHVHTIMPGLTHRQAAQPITFGFWLLGLAASIDRDLDRLRQAYRRTNLNPMGAAAFSGTRIDIDRERTTALLGFDGLVENALDAVASRDFLFDAAFAVGLQALAVGRAANDLIMWNSNLVGGIEVADATAGVSSIMPQKKNAIALEHCRSRAGAIVGALTGLFAIARGTFLEHARDASDMLAPFSAASEDGRSVRELFHEVLGSLQVFTDRLAQRAGNGFSTVTDVADWLAVEKSWSFRASHEVLARAVRIEIDRNPGAETISAAALDEASSLLGRKSPGIGDDELAQLLDPLRSVTDRRSRGGTSPASVRAMIAHLRTRSVQEDAWLTSSISALEHAEAQRETDFRTLASTGS